MPASRPRFARRHFLRAWCVSTLVLFVLSLVWALCTPLGASPDEPTQIVKAAAVVRGELVGSPVTRSPEAFVVVRVPASFADDANLSTCYAGLPTKPAGCAPHLSTSSAPTPVATYVGRYPPLYYLLVGTPTLLWRGSGAVYAMRILGALWGAVLLGLAVAVAAIWSRSRLLLPALAVAVTPMAVFLCGTVNPSGLEIAAAVSTWTAALVLVLDHRRRPPAGLVAALAVSASVLALCRGLSPLWLVLMAGSIALLGPGATGDLWRHRGVRWAAAGTATLGAVAVAWILRVHTLAVLPVGVPVPKGASVPNLLVDALGQTGHYMREAVGVFGWLDTASPLAVMAGWWMALAVVVVLGLVTSGRRHALTLVGVMTAAVVVPTIIIASRAAADGLVWQARDGLPLYVGIPLLAGAVAGRGGREPGSGRGSDDRAVLPGSSAARRLALLVVGGVAAGQFVDVVWALRRYTVGLGRTLAPWAHVPGGWQPPLPVVLLLVGAAAGSAAYGWWMLRLWRPAADRGQATVHIAVGPPFPATVPRPPSRPAPVVPSSVIPTSVLVPACQRADAMIDRVFPALAGAGSRTARPPLVVAAARSHATTGGGTADRRPGNGHGWAYDIGRTLGNGSSSSAGAANGNGHGKVPFGDIMSGGDAGRSAALFDPDRLLRSLLG